MKLVTIGFKIEKETERAMLLKLGHAGTFWLPKSRLEIKGDVLTVNGWASMALANTEHYNKKIKFKKVVEIFNRNNTNMAA